MANFAVRPEIMGKITIELTESEARAWDALVSYGDDAFIKTFYEKLGEAYMREHEAGLRTLFKTTRSILPGVLDRIDIARRAFNYSGTVAFLEKKELKI